MNGVDETRIYQCVLGECPGSEKPGGVTNTLKTYLEDALAVKERLGSHIAELQSLEDYVGSEIKKTQFALAVYEDDAKIAEALQSASRGDSPEGQPDEVFCGKAGVSDIENCGTQRKALYVIAQMNCGRLDLNSASELIVAAKLSKTTPRSVSGQLHSYLSSNEDFEWIGAFYL